MFCESAQRECRYLDELEDLKDESILLQASVNNTEVRQAKAVYKVVEDIFSGNEVGDCDADYCSLLLMAVRDMAISRAKEEIGK